MKAQAQTPLTDVIFRKEKEGTILAVFPYIMGTRKGDYQCYAHIGQHSYCDYFDYVLKCTEPAKPTEYANLKRELENLSPEPYRLNVVKRMNRRRYSAAYFQSNMKW